MFHDRVEILIYDDGSSDESAKIAQEYRFRYPHIVKYTGSNSNRGPGFARNRAFRDAEGDYVWFFDGDDEAESGLVTAILEIIQTGYDTIYLEMVHFNHRKAWPDTHNQRVIDFINVYGQHTVFDSESRKAALMLHFAPWRVVFRRSLIPDRPFCPTSYTEDLYFYLKVIIRADSFAVLRGYRVRYRRRPGQLTSRNSAAIWSVNETFRYILNDIVEPGNSTLLWNVFLERYLGKLRHLTRTQLLTLTPRFRRSVTRFWKTIPNRRVRKLLESLGPCFHLEYFSIQFGFFPEMIVICKVLRFVVTAIKRGYSRMQISR